MEDILVVIPARGGSKGLPGKNIKMLCGKPLIAYSIDVARAFADDKNICVSTDSEEIKQVVEQYGLKVPFLRPDYLATDTATSDDVLIHAVNYYREQYGRTFKILLLLQPTSPLRTKEDVEEAIRLYRDDIDMVVSVMKSHAPAVLCHDDEQGYVQLSCIKKALGRQQLPDMYEFNGAVYVMSVDALLEKKMAGFTKIVKYVMSKEHSIDIDDIYDFLQVESILKYSK